MKIHQVLDWGVTLAISIWIIYKVAIRAGICLNEKERIRRVSWEAGNKFKDHCRAWLSHYIEADGGDSEIWFKCMHCWAGLQMCLHSVLLRTDWWIILIGTLHVCIGNNFLNVDWDQAGKYSTRTNIIRVRWVMVEKAQMSEGGLYCQSNHEMAWAFQRESSVFTTIIPESKPAIFRRGC